jgi:hypothetical protein
VLAETGEELKVRIVSLPVNVPKIGLTCKVFGSPVPESASYTLITVAFLVGF